MNRLARYLSVLLRRRRFVLWNTFALTAIAIVVSLILPQRFTATARLLPPSDDGDMYGLSSVLGGGAGSRLSRLRGGVLGGSTSSDLMVGILASRTVVHRVAERCSIAAQYRIQPDRVDEIVKRLRQMTTLESGDEGIVSISVEARTRTLAANLANAYVGELDSFLRMSNISRGRSMRIFLERRLAQTESTLALARDSLRVFQQRSGVVSIDDETKAAIDVYAEVQSQLGAKEAELIALSVAASDGNPGAVRLRTEISGLREELRKFERGRAGAEFGVGFGVSFRRLPGVASEFARRYQDFRVQEESYAALFQQYEYARLLEVRDTPVLTVLDYAVPPQRRSFPRRALIVGAVFAFSLAAGVCFAFVSEYFEYIKIARPDEYRTWTSLHEEVALVRRELRFFFHRDRK